MSGLDHRRLHRAEGSTQRRELAPGGGLALREAASGSRALGRGRGRGRGTAGSSPKAPEEQGRVTLQAEWPVTVHPTAQVRAMLPGCSVTRLLRGFRRRGLGLGLHSYPQLLARPTPRLGMRPRPFLIDGQTDGQQTRVSSYKGALFHSPTADHHRVVSWQVRVGKELSVPCHLGQSRQASQGH